MKYKESFKENINPFIFSGVMGRLSYLVINLIVSVLSGLLYWVFCPKTFEAAANISISQGKSYLEVLLVNSPESELWIYVLWNFIGLLICFVVNKKRILDILGEKPNSVRLSIIYSSILFLLSLQTNFLTPLGSLQASFLAFGTSIIGLILLFKKGAITGNKLNKVDEADVKSEEPVNTNDD